MPPGRLTEKYVKEATAHWLARRYQQQPDVQIALPYMEVRVSLKTRLGRGRADGLVVADLDDGTIHTASLEAKSWRTIFSISPWHRDGNWFLHAVLIGGIGLVVAGVIGWSVQVWFWMWIFPLLVFILVGFAYLTLTLENSRYRSIDVIDQVKRYPANEQWIAVSTDAYNLLRPEERKTLRKDCRSEGIGVVRISRGPREEVLVKPIPKATPKDHRDFLECYARAKVIRRELHEKLRHASDEPTDVI